MKTTIILTCAGKGSRAQFDCNKLLQKIDNELVIEKSYNAFLNSGLIDDFIITASKTDFDFLKNLFPTATIVLGGSTRTESIKNALPFVKTEIVLIHDGARPFVNNNIISSCIESVKQYGSGISAYQSTDTIALATDNNIDSVLGKNGVYIIQTPQGFLTKDIAFAYSKLPSNADYPDDSSVYKEYVKPPKLSLGDKSNIKLTYKSDFMPSLRTGVGYDCHKLVDNRKLILGGIEIPHTKGLLGHSDADVLTHAIMDAMLSACALRDIGYHFSDTDNKYKDISSMLLLEKVKELITNSGYKVNNISAVIMADKPKLLNHLPKITTNIAKALNVDEKFIGIGATTLEGLGFVGREEGICVHATATLIKI